MADRDGTTAEAHLVHGLTEGDVAPDWPPLGYEEIGAALAAAGTRLTPVAPAAGSALWHSPRPYSAACLVEVGGGRRVLVKRHHHDVRSVDAMAVEQAYARWLRQRGVPAAAPLGSAEMGDFVYEVQEAAPGVDRYREAWSWTPYEGPDDASAAGRMLARMHDAAAGFDAPVRAPAPLLGSMTVANAGEPLEAVAEMAAALGGLADYLAARDWRSDLGDRLTEPHAAFAELAPSLAPLFTHNDWHPSNLLWAGRPSCGEQAEVTAIIDFGLSNETTAVYDLATAIERSCVGWLQPAAERHVHLDQAAALLAGYRSVRPLGAAEAAALPRLLPIVHVEYALSEIEYFHGVVGSASNADLAYDAYLLGHLDWFAGAAGRRLCEAIEALCVA